MRVSTKMTAAVLSSAVLAATAFATSPAAATRSRITLDSWTSVPAVTKAVGLTAPNVLSPQLAEHPVAQGSMPLDGATTDLPFYGYRGDGPMLPAPGALPAVGAPVVEATKTEPDKNTYLVLEHQVGADPAYRYGEHFLFQGHEGGGHGALTRINLDADAAHRVTLLAGTDITGATLPTFDGSTWNPFTKQLLLTTEGSPTGIYQATASYPSRVQDLSSVIGDGAYEGVQTDAAGSIWLVEDIGGTTIPDTKVKLPNSFVYRFVPVDKADLTKGGKLQALQVISNASGLPITFQPIDAAHPTGNAFSPDQKALHVYGSHFVTHWVTVHDTALDSSGAVFTASTLAKAAGATPFKRPENGVFRPGTHFGQFIFDETGDTNATSTANDDFGGWGSVFALTQQKSTSDTGSLSLILKGNQAHTGFDNLTFLDDRHVAVVEDAGDTLHTQRAAFDSGYVLDVTHNYADAAAPTRFLAEGRDPSAAVDSGLSAIAGFQNDGDNEITGIHVSNGDASPHGLLGATVPHLFHGGWRFFWTQQHGDNITWEVTPAGK